MTIMRGYDIYVYTPLDKTTPYEGTLNTGNQSISVTAGGDGWNMVGNPYPSAIDWEASSGWTKTNVNDATYCMRSDGNYAIWSFGMGINDGTQYIPAGQGFLVKATSGGTLGVTNEVRVHDTQDFWKNNKQNKSSYPLMRLEVDGNGYTDEAIVRFIAGSTNDFDNWCDAYKKFADNNQIPQLYTVTPDETELSISTMPQITPIFEIPTNLKVGANDTYTITATAISNFDPAIEIYLIDNKEEVTIDLNTNPDYEFTANTTDDYDRFTLRFVAPTTSSSWTGSTSTDWNTAANWSTASVPDCLADVNIPSAPSNQPIIDDNSYCNNLILEAAAELTVNSGKNLIIYGNFSIESDATGTGSFIDNGTITYKGTSTVKRFLSRASWHYFSPPLVNTLSDDVAGVGNNFWTYNESYSDWDFIDSGTELSVMKGYNVYVYTPIDKTSIFTGTLNTGACSINTTADGDGWNMIGNPYPSAIDWDAASGWTKTNVNDAIYFMKSDGNFANYILGMGTNGGSQYIPAMQGVFVYATGSGSVGVTNEVRVHNSQAFWKSNKSNDPVLRLTANGNNHSDEMVLRFSDMATDQFDGSLDAYKRFTGNELIPQIYSLTNSNDTMSINSLPELNGSIIIPVGFVSGVPGTYTINFDGISSLNQDATIFFEDQKDNIMVNMRDMSEYTFSYSTSDNNNRFLIHLSDQPVKINNTPDDYFDVYSFNKSVYIQNNNLNKYSVEIYDLLGNMIQKRDCDVSFLRIDLNISSGYYIIKTSSNTEVFNKKIFIK